MKNKYSHLLLEDLYELRKTIQDGELDEAILYLESSFPKGVRIGRSGIEWSVNRHRENLLDVKKSLIESEEKLRNLQKEIESKKSEIDFYELQIKTSEEIGKEYFCKEKFLLGEKK